MSRAAGLALVLALLVPGLAGAEEAVQPADVYLAVEQVAADVRVLQRHRGVQPDDRPPPAVQEASPFEVYLQARTLYEKVERLAFQDLRTEEVAPPLPEGAIRPAQVRELIVRSRARLAQVLEAEGLHATTEVPSRDPGHTPSDVYQRAVAVHRQINPLLQEQFTPADVFQQVTQSLAFATALRSRFPGARPPPMRDFESGKLPGDVHAQLRRCFDEVVEIATLTHRQTLRMSEDLTWDITPDDVRELAVLVLAELRQLHAGGSAPAPIQVPYPGEKTPSEVHQRARILEAVLTDLREAVAARPELLPLPRTDR